MVHQTRSYSMVFVNYTYDINVNTRYLVLSFTQNMVRACSMFYAYEGYRSVTPLDAEQKFLNFGKNGTVVTDLDCKKNGEEINSTFAPSRYIYTRTVDRCTLP